MKLKFDKPVYAQCRICFKKYDMVEWGVECPTCKKKKVEPTALKIKVAA